MHSFCHLHCHTDYSLLDGAAQIQPLIRQTKQLGMKAVAITDHGNLFGVPHFVNAAKKEGIKPILGCEFYLAADRHSRKDKKRYHQLILAKNAVGYQNLVKLCSLSFLEGYYYKPRIDKSLLQQYATGLIATTCCLGAEVPQMILHQGEEAAEKCFLEWVSLFGSDYYIELQRHGIPEQDRCNTVLLRWAHKYHVQVIATNDVHYIEQQDSIVQDVLLCLQTGKDYTDPKRMRFENDQFYIKSPQEMAVLFQDIPEALDNTLAIAEQITPFSLERDILLPIFKLPADFSNSDVYLKQLTLTGAAQRYTTLTDTIQERIDYELAIIQKTGFADYFLIVRDMIQAAQTMHVLVGPGRGSVTGSIVAYCIGITQVDPLQYQLLFERFLNPDRVSMPDIDIDFDDEGRQKVIDYVVEKYSKDQVAHIITFGSMAAKSAIRDVARVLGVPLEKANTLAKLLPDKPGMTLLRAFEEIPELARWHQDTTSAESKVLALAAKLEGTVRHTGIHAAGIIIAPDHLLNHIPLKTDKHTQLLVTQYDGSVLEQTGMLKMDLLGLKTLSIIKDTLALIEAQYGHSILLDQLPLDDAKTFALYQQGHTKATFQFESQGMRKWLIKLHPTNLEDLIAMNALYRPGPMQFIPHFIARKHGKEPIDYLHPLLVDILKNTYGIMLYQEQIIQIAQHMAGYSLGTADLLRKAMGKKQAAEMAQQREIFVQGAAQKHHIDRAKAIEIFDVMENFAQYGFNRSHATAYSLVAYQTGYLKAHYPAEYMAAVLTHNQHDREKITVFMEECKRQGLAVLGPDINESQVNFSVNPAQQIRFGLGAIKGVGEAAVQEIITTREKNGAFQDLFDLAERVNIKAVNKKTLENLALAGALDAFPAYHRKQYVVPDDTGLSLVEKAIEYGKQIKKEANTRQPSLFAATPDQPIKKPTTRACEPYEAATRLCMEKETVGFYISGHPLDPFQVELASFCTGHTQNALTQKGKEVRLAGMVVACTVRQNKQGRPFAFFTLEDYEGTLDLALYGEDFLKHKHLLETGSFLYLIGNVVTRYNQSEVWELRPHTIDLLSEVKTKRSKRVQLYVAASQIDPAFIHQLEQLVAAHPGSHELQIAVSRKKGEVVLLSSKYRIHPTEALLAAFSAMKGVVCRLGS